MEVVIRMHDTATFTETDNDELEPSKQDKIGRTTFAAAIDSQERMTMKWASMWRSIILSSLDKTLFPYSKFIRALRLQDLQDLLQDDKFRVPKVADALFAGELAKFRIDKPVQVTRKRNTYVAIDTEATVNGFAEIITRKTPMLEEFSGNELLAAGIPQHSIPKLPNLQTLKVFRGEALENTGSLLRDHCPLFNTLSFYGWQHPEADSHLATLLGELRPNSLRSFEVHGSSQIGPESFLALNNHRESLRELKLPDTSASALPDLVLLKGCTNIQTLLLSEQISTQDLEKDHNDRFLEMIAWLRECTSLQSLTFHKFISAPALLKHVALEHKVRLNRLELVDYNMPANKEFHQALAHQVSLQHLHLRGDPGEAPHESNILVESLSKLIHLIDLRLQDISDYFLNHHIIQLASNLPKLEAFETSGYGITDEIWPAMRNLNRLRYLQFNALSRFTTDGLINFIFSLLPSNLGLKLIVMMQENDHDISEDEQVMIRQAIEDKVGGRFSFMLWKGRQASRMLRVDFYMKTRGYLANG